MIDEETIRRFFSEKTDKKNIVIDEDFYQSVEKTRNVVDQQHKTSGIENAEQNNQRTAL